MKNLFLNLFFVFFGFFFNCQMLCMQNDALILLEKNSCDEYIIELNTQADNVRATPRELAELFQIYMSDEDKDDDQDQVDFFRRLEQEKPEQYNTILTQMRNRHQKGQNQETQLEKIERLHLNKLSKSVKIAKEDLKVAKRSRACTKFWAPICLVSPAILPIVSGLLIWEYVWVYNACVNS